MGLFLWICREVVTDYFPQIWRMSVDFLKKQNYLTYGVCLDYLHV